MDDARPTILVVDDDLDALAAEAMALAELGYNVLPSNGGHEALLLIAREPSIDMVLTDIVMRGDFDGFTLAERIHRVRPTLKVAYTSGYMAPTASANMLLRNQRLLRKPWRLQELEEFIRRVLTD